MGTKSQVEKNIRDVARRIKSRMIVASGGRLPRSLAGWIRLCMEMGVEPVPLYRSPDRFRARLLVTDQGTFAFYNRFASMRVICHWLAHEIAEKVALEDLPALFDEMPIMANYSGDADPYDVRHRIARRVEQLCFRR